jgi:hypothetical protein
MNFSKRIIIFDRIYLYKIFFFSIHNKLRKYLCMRRKNQSINICTFSGREKPSIECYQNELIQQFYSILFSKFSNVIVSFSFNSTFASIYFFFLSFIYTETTCEFDAKVAAIEVHTSIYIHHVLTLIFSDLVPI